MKSFSEVDIDEVKNFWDNSPCNINHSSKLVGTKEYFNEVEARKYFVEPHIPRFAEFEKWRGKKVLEIGCGIGTDTINFAKHGAQVTAIELSECSLLIAKERAQVYGLDKNISFYLGNAEKLTQIVPQEPYDLIYSFGVIHHTPNPEKIIEQMSYYVHPESIVKIMIYHKYSWKVLELLLTYGKFQIWKLPEIVARYSEAQKGSPVTYAFTISEAKKLLEHGGFKISNVSVEHIFPYEISNYIQHRYIKKWYFRFMFPFLFRYLERNFGWHLCLSAKVVKIK